MAAYVEVWTPLAQLACHKLIHHSCAATTEDLQRFVRLLFSSISGGHVARDSSTKHTEHEHSTAIMPLRSPVFWELPELRCMHSPRFRDLIPHIGLTAAVLVYLSEKTSNLDITDIVKTLENLLPSSNFSKDIHEIRAVYTILRYTPMEYLPKNARVDLTKKAIVIDAQLISALKPGPAHNDLMDILSLCREYTSRSITYAAVFDRPVSYHFLPSTSS